MAIDVTQGKFISSKQWVSFAETGAVAGDPQQLISLDNTTSQQRFQIEQIVLGCATGGNVAVMDGSAGLPIVRCNAGGDVTTGTLGLHWDWHNDPLLTRADITSLCISAAGTFTGFIKFGW